VIERKAIAGFDYVRVSTQADLDEWAQSERWASATDFTAETNADFQTLKGHWFMYTPGPQRCFVYVRTMAGIRAIF
jgi:hypothetical protein